MDAQTSPLPTVLIVEDYRDGADTLAEMLRLAGHPVRVAYHPTEAVRLAAQSPPDVVLLDIGLPDMNGYELARRLCQVAGRRPVLVAMTGYGNLDERSRREGFDHHFLKPVEPADLARLLAAHVPVEEPLAAV